MNRKIAIRCIADPIHGYGHFSRCLSLATYFSKKNYSILFLINDNKNLKNELTKINLKYFVIPTFKTTSQEGNFLKDFIVRNNISCFILDMKELSEPLSKKIMYSCLTVIIDDSSVNKVYSDIILNGTNIKKYQKYKITHKKTKLLIGPEYFLSNLEFTKNKKRYSEIKLKKKYTVVISCGGSDINNLTWKIFKEILPLPNIQIQVVIGPLMKKNIPKKITNNSVQIFSSPPKIWKIFEKADLVICTSGSTLFELAIQGIPCINIATVKHQIPYGLEFSASGFGKYMGFWKELDFSDLKTMTQKLLSNTKERKKMSSTGKKLVDGNGIKKFETVIRSTIK